MRFRLGPDPVGVLPVSGLGGDGEDGVPPVAPPQTASWQLAAYSTRLGRASQGPHL